MRTYNLTIKNYFLKEFFSLLHDYNISYCVIHGYEDLPLNYKGHDLDILINYKDLYKIKKVVHYLIKKYELNIFRIEKRQQLFEFVLFDEKLETIILQFIFQMDYKGIPIFENKDVFLNSIKYKDISIPSMLHEYTYSFFVRFFWGKEIHNKYFLNFKNIYHMPEVQKKVKEMFGEKYAKIFWAAVLEEDRHKLLKLRKKLVIRFFLNGFKKKPYALIMGMSKRYIFGIYNAIKHKGRFIVLIGPDGVGKTTIALILMDIFKDFYRGIKYFHFMPNKFIDRNKIKTYNQKRSLFIPKRYSSIISILRLLRNAIRFNYYYVRVIYYKYKQNLIIGDRYFYNYFFYPTSMKYSASQSLVHIVYNLLPKPDFIFCLEASPEIILSRKNELNQSEILEQIIIIKEVLSNKDNVHIIKNNNDPKDAAIKIAKIILGK